MEKRHRIFIAINLPDDIKKSLAKYEEKWKDIPARWTKKENLHITVEFLGDLTDQEIADVCEAANKVCKNQQPLDVVLKGVKYGPDDKNSLPAGRQAPKMIWAFGEKSDELASFRQALQNALLEKIAFRPEGRGFVPHVTLARIKETEWRMIEPEERPEVQENFEYIFTVESVEVMESELKRGGPVYTVLESCPFEGAKSGLD